MYEYYLHFAYTKRHFAFVSAIFLLTYGTRYFQPGHYRAKNSENTKDEGPQTGNAG